MCVKSDIAHLFSRLLSRTVDARSLTVPGGKTIMLIIREGVAYIPNPELAKILPNVTRTAMEVIRNTYGIVVEQVSLDACVSRPPSITQSQ